MSTKDQFLAKATILIGAPKSKVWEALTKPDLIKQYLFGTQAITDWQVGSPITYKGVGRVSPMKIRGRLYNLSPKNSWYRLFGAHWQAYQTPRRITKPYVMKYFLQAMIQD